MKNTKRTCYMMYFPIVMGPNFPMPEIKTVSADKIFDIPGRAERPSHVCMCACVYVCVRACV